MSCLIFTFIWVNFLHDSNDKKQLFLNFSIKCNRSYTDFALYTMPVKPVIMSEVSLKELGVEINGTKMEVDTNGQNGHDTFNSDDNPYFLHAF